MDGEMSEAEVVDMITKIDQDAAKCGCKADVIATVEELVREAGAAARVFPETAAELGNKFALDPSLITHTARDTRHHRTRIIDDMLVVVSLNVFACGKRNWHASIGQPKRCKSMRDAATNAWIQHALGLHEKKYDEYYSQSSGAVHYDWTEPLLS